MPNRLISICIPTCNRPRLLELALDSCFAQTYPNLEVVIGDDSRNADSERVVQRFIERHGHRVNYVRNQPPLGQAGNVNSLFARAGGDRLLLLHDDDLLLPGALLQLASCWRDDSDLSAAFGKQSMITHGGAAMDAASEELNSAYHRVAANSGRLPVPAIAGISQMFPNNGYLVDTALAREIGYRPPAEVGEACDFDFALRLCLRARGIYFLNEYVSVWRVTDVSISKHALPAMYAYKELTATPVPAAADAAKAQALHRLAPLAASAFARSGDAGAALRVIFSRHYSWSNKFSLRCLFHVWLAVASMFRQLSGGKKQAT